MNRRKFLKFLVGGAVVGTGVGVGIVSLEKLWGEITARKEWPNTPFFKGLEELYKKESGNPDDYLDGVVGLVSNLGSELPKSIKKIDLFVSGGVNGAISKFSVSRDIHGISCFNFDSNNVEKLNSNELQKKFDIFRNTSSLDLKLINIDIEYSFVAAGKIDELPIFGNIEIAHYDSFRFEFSGFPVGALKKEYSNIFGRKLKVGGEDRITQLKDQFYDKDGKIIGNEQRIVGAILQKTTNLKPYDTFIAIADWYNQKRNEFKHKQSFIK